MPDVDFPDEFYGFTEIPWTNVYQRAVTTDDDVRMEFIEPDPDTLADIREKGAFAEVLKGQFFAARSKAEQESGRKPGLIALARSLLNGFV